MDITPTPTTTTTILSSSTTKPQLDDPETDAPTRIQQPKPLAYSNGVLKRLHHHHHHAPPPPPTPSSAVVTYKECLKNHAATIGGHALDGCGEFMPSPTSTPTNPTSLKCAACGCHRNFHRRDPDDTTTSSPLLSLPPPPTATTTTIEYQPYHRHQPPPPPTQPAHSPDSASPPPISSSYYRSAPHMLLSLSGGASDANPLVPSNNSSSRKRFRTKFTQDQKDRMFEFAERLGWKMQKRDEELIHEFCNEVKVDKGVFKVWMHNNKNTYVKSRETNGAMNSSIGINIEDPIHAANSDNNHLESDGAVHGNGSNSSSS